MAHCSRVELHASNTRLTSSLCWELLPSLCHDSFRVAIYLYPQSSMITSATYFQPSGLPRYERKCSLHYTLDEVDQLYVY